jgi:hypothetical protein
MHKSYRLEELSPTYREKNRRILVEFSHLLCKLTDCHDEIVLKKEPQVIH